MISISRVLFIPSEREVSDCRCLFLFSAFSQVVIGVVLLLLGGLFFFFKSDFLYNLGVFLFIGGVVFTVRWIKCVKVVLE